MHKVMIAKSNSALKSRASVGERCENWLLKNMPANFELTTKFKEADFLFSLFYGEKINIGKLSKSCKAFNFHAGILPFYRGSGTLNFAIINKEKETGITLHELDENIDTGPIIKIHKFEIEPLETAESLLIKAEDETFNLFTKEFPTLIKGDFKSYQQDSNHSRFYSRKELHDIKDMTHIVRAFSLNGKESAYYYNKSGKKIYADW